MFQFRAPRYVPGIYWLAVVLISVVGTQIVLGETRRPSLRSSPAIPPPH